jgi:21S rRNA (uridine2791-2'-O)-methyltransferase
VLGIDIIPAQPPKGVSTIQGNFLSAAVQAEVKDFLSHPGRGRPRQQRVLSTTESGDTLTHAELDDADVGYVDLKRRADTDDSGTTDSEEDSGHLSRKQKEKAEGRMVDVVLSDMSAPWEQTTGFWKRSLSDPYYRMMNTSGMSFRDHAGSMVQVQPIREDPRLAYSCDKQDLCMAALQFCSDTLRIGGYFVCKFYQGAEDKALEAHLKRLFHKVHREKPESSRSVMERCATAKNYC